MKLHDFDIYTDYINPFRNKVQEYGAEELFSPFTTNVLYPVSALNPAYEVIDVLYLLGYFTFNHDKEIDDETAKNPVNWVEKTNFTNMSNGKRIKCFDDLISM